MNKRQETTGFSTLLILGIAAVAWSTGFSEASAQIQLPPGGQKSESPAPAPPGAPKPPLPGEGSSTPSDNLSRSGGVIQPPIVADPGMTRPAPHAGAQSMPVIPPPGSPGSNSDVVPK